MILVLVRHGQTDGSVEKKYCGSLDIPLNDQGRSQSEKLALRIKAFNINRVYSSDLKRAIQTAHIVFKGQQVVSLPVLREMNFGILEGLTFTQAIEQFPDIYKAWINCPWSITLPQAESFKDFRARVLGGLEGLLAKNIGQSIAVVSHSGPIRVILSEALGLKAEEFWSIGQDNAAINVIEYLPSQKPKVLVQNDTGYL